MLQDQINKLNSLIISLHANEVDLLVVVVGASFTLLAAFIAVFTAFKQLAKQLEHKVLYEGWKDLQQKLFDFSTALSNYDSNVQWLSYVIKSENNSLVNQGNRAAYRLKEWNKVTNSYLELQHAYIGFLISYETHEVIFLPLKKMHKAFISEYRKKVEDKHHSFIEQIFPEMYGKKISLTDEKLLKQIDKFWYETTEFSAFLDDFRKELQNVTVGKILNKSVPRRKAEGFRILTKKGFIDGISWRQRFKKRKFYITKIRSIFKRYPLIVKV